MILAHEAKTRKGNDGEDEDEGSSLEDEGLRRAEVSSMSF